MWVIAVLLAGVIPAVGAEERATGVYFINGAGDTDFFGTGTRLIIDAGTRYAENF